MSGFAADPSLQEVFAAELADRLAGFADGLIAWESAPEARVPPALLRDVHTLKGSARMLGLTGVVALAHAVEDVLGAARDGRLAVTREVVGDLLEACRAVERCLPDAAEGLTPDEQDALVDRLAALTRGATGLPRPRPAPPFTRTEVPARPVVTPPAASRAGTFGPAFAPLPDPVPEAEQVTPADPAWPADGDPLSPAPGGPPPEPSSPVRPGVAPAAGATLRVPAASVHGVIETAGEIELEARRAHRGAAELARVSAELAAGWTALQARVPDAAAGPEAVRLATAVHRLGDLVALAPPQAEDHAHRVTALRGAALALAMVPLSQVVGGYPRLVRELAGRAGREVHLRVVGAEVELDSRVLEAVGGALTHLVTNAVDHGVDPPEQRLRAGKPAGAVVTVAARSAGNRVVIEVSDDGAGIDEAAVRARAGASATEPLLEVLARPHFSTAGQVTASSGRGMGLDAVRAAVESLGGSVSLQTVPGRGTTFALTVPVTLGVMHCLLARVGRARYALPVDAVSETVRVSEAHLHQLAGLTVLVRDGEAIPVADLGLLLGEPPGEPARHGVVVATPAGPVVLAVQRLEGERECVVSPLGAYLATGVSGVAGATLDDDGTVVVVLDPVAWAGRALSAGAPSAAGSAVEPDRVLVVDDSDGIRELLRRVLGGAGYAVTVCRDGQEGLAALAGTPARCVVTDIEMPGADGFALTAAIRAHPVWSGVPVLVMTSLGSEIDRRRGMDAGADAWLCKQDFDAAVLVATVRRLVGR